MLLGVVPVLCVGAIASDSGKPRVIVLTDIGNEPDDAESLVRFLLYSNDLQVEGLIATTSTWQRTRVRTDLVEERVRAYGKVLPNLRIHAPGYPDMERLLSVIKAGRAEYGMSGVGVGKETDASKLIIAAADRLDARPVWLTLWGGSVDLAQALWSVRETRSPQALAHFVARLRVYAISDQDDAASWIRANFPTLFWVGSTHSFGSYRLATWIGISAPLPGADQMVVSKDWLEANIRKGALGTLYPLPMFIMEGDTPSFLYLLPNGLGSPDQPGWGSWGGRYGRVGPSLGLYGDTMDAVLGVDGRSYSGNQATVWRWRREFQNDFAARVAWSTTSDLHAVNHSPHVVVNGEDGLEAIELATCANKPVKLSAAGTSDPDGDTLQYRWWQYLEASEELNPQALVIHDAGAAEASVVAPPVRKPSLNVELPPESRYHVILSVTDAGQPALTRYRRVILKVPAEGTPASSVLGCAGAGGV
ncbi:MAG: nucleoside hydrolase-like domain-containing protein [Pseudomonadota bacterium]